MTTHTYKTQLHTTSYYKYSVYYMYKTTKLHPLISIRSPHRHKVLSLNILSGVADSAGLLDHAGGVVSRVEAEDHQVQQDQHALETRKG